MTNLTGEIIIFAIAAVTGYIVIRIAGNKREKIIFSYSLWGIITFALAMLLDVNEDPASANTIVLSVVVALSLLSFLVGIIYWLKKFKPTDKDADDGVRDNGYIFFKDHKSIKDD